MNETKDLAPRANADVAIQSPRDMIGVIARAAADPNVDPAKMQQLIDVQERLMKMAAKQSFNAALVEIQGRMPQIERDGRIAVNGQVRSKFSRLETIDAVIRPLMLEYGFGITFHNPENAGGSMKFTGTLRHRDGHEEPYSITLPIDSSGSKNGTQSGGSTSSYAQRYLIKQIFNVVTKNVDDDGHGGPVETITENQAMNIDTALSDAGANRAKFLQWAGVQKISDIPAVRYKEAMDLIARSKNKRDRK